MSNWMNENGERVRRALGAKGFVFDESGKVDFDKTDIDEIPFRLLTEEEMRVIFPPADKFISECEDDDGFDFSKVASHKLTESTKMWGEFALSCDCEEGEILSIVADLRVREFMYIYNTDRQNAEWFDNAYIDGVEESEVTKYVDLVINTILTYFVGYNSGFIEDVINGYRVVGWPFISGFADRPEVVNLLASVACALNEHNPSV